MTPEIEAFEWYCNKRVDYETLKLAEQVPVAVIPEENGYSCDFCGVPATAKMWVGSGWPVWACNEHMGMAKHDVQSRWALDQMEPGPQRAKTAEPNPKDLLGIKKPPNLSVIPSSALIHMGRAMQNGANKYGPFNWREHPVKSGIYVDAAIRHLSAWQDGEEDASDSGVHHLGHAMACMGIILDAQEVGNLIDERVPGPMPEMIARFTED